MQIVINIDDDVYKRALVYKDVQLASNRANDLSELITAVANGIPLPKRHGKIIDVDQFYKAFNEYLSERKSFSFADLETILNAVTPPILKTNKEVENHK